MKKYKLALSVAATSLLTVVPAISGACVGKTEKTPKTPETDTGDTKKDNGKVETPKKDFKIILNSDAQYAGEEAKVALIQKLESKLPAYKFTIEFTEDYTTALDEVIKGSAHLAFPSVGALMSNEKHNEVNPYLQTLARSFNNDSTAAVYVDGTLENDPLRKLGASETEEFNATPYANWDPNNWDKTNYIYTNFYDSSKKVNYQRGAIWISGTDEVRANIIKAWNDKDWATFKSFGVIHGSSDSGSKFILPQNLLKLHFNKEDNKFTTLSEEILNNANLFVEGKIAHLHKDASKHIVFDNQGSYSWTKSKEENLSKYTPRDGEKLEILTLTNPIPYNLGVFNKDLPKEVIETISDTFIELANADQDPTGKSQGFVGYEKINDLSSVISMYENGTK